MDKLWLIIKREYLTRVQKRSFIIATILTPLAFGLFFIVVGYIFTYEGDKGLKVAVIDDAKVLNATLADDKKVYFQFPKEELKVLIDNYENNNFDGILHVPALKDMNTKKHTIYFYSDKQMSLDVSNVIQRRVRKSIKDYKIEAFGLDKKELASLDTKITVDPKPINESDEDTSEFASIIAAGIGGAMGVIMYMTVFIYGMMVMRSVMEEKVNRIVEVMISTVKPFQLMMGKIIGVGAVGLTQVAIWAVLIPLISILVNLVFGFDPQEMNAGAGQAMGGAAQQLDINDMEFMFGKIMTELRAQNWWMIIPLFLFYFLGGYFLYASLFAAVGSAMGDDLGEGQALTIPITIPVVIAFYIMFVAVRAPNSNLAIWSSIFPLFSPIVMPSRLAFDPPMWQLLLSIFTLAASSIFFVWLSARIYRVGILMYGKKITFRELGKWIFYKD